MRYPMISILLILLLMTFGICSQDLSNSKSIFKPSELVQKPKGFLNYLLDPSRFEMSQSYSFSLISSGSRSTNVGLYLNTMTYQFSDPLLMQLRIGYLHQPFGGPNNLGLSDKGSVFIQDAHIQYKPMKNMIISLDYGNYPALIYSPYYLNRW